MKAPDINIKEVLKKLSFLKNNLALLVPIVIVIVAALLFIPGHIFARRLRSTVEKQSVGTGKKVERLARDVNSVADAESLETYIDQYTRDANAIDALVAQTAERELLSYDIFPDTNETSIALYEAFGRQYRAGVEAMLERMNAGVSATQDEVTAALKGAPRRGPMQGRGGYGGEAYGGGGGASPYGEAYGGAMGRMGQSFGMMDPTSRKIVDQICLDRARAASVYAALADVAGYAYWDDWKFEDRTKAYNDCWYWQLGYWIIEDITETIRVMNEGSPNILDAPVKRFSNVDFRMKRSRAGRRPGRGGRRKSNEDTYPIYAIDTKDALTTPCTGRFTNEVFDVVQFNVTLVVEVDRVVPVMQELSSAKKHKFRGFYGKQPEKTYLHNQISVLESAVGPIDPEGFEHNLYRYGDSPVVELNLLCEYVFHRTPAFEGIKPEQIKKELSGEEEEEV